MAITIESQPYSFTARGQRLMFIATSDNTGELQFKYGVKVTATSTGQVLQFLVTPDIDGKLIFDLQSVVKLRNEDSFDGWHSNDFSNITFEPSGAGIQEYDVQLQEWWLVTPVGGAPTMTENESARVNTGCRVFNASLSPSYGYRPNPDTSGQPYSFAMSTITSQVLTDRIASTHKWYMADSFAIGSVDAVYIPVFNGDYGLLSIIATDLYDLNDFPFYAKYNIYDNAGFTYGFLLDVSPEKGIVHIPCFPKNISGDIDITYTPDNLSNWAYYTIQIEDNDANNVSLPYCFYNAATWGQVDCRFDRVRLGWVSSRGGWDYFNFIKKNEWNNQIERKQYRRVLYRNSTDIFLPADRQLFDRENIVTRNMTITSDWLQEGEFVFLKNLLFSNQVQMINIDGTQTPVSITDTAFSEKKERSGKKYNITLTITLSQDYWL
jgi:hypothetical protein